MSKRSRRQKRAKARKAAGVNDTPAETAMTPAGEQTPDGGLGGLLRDPRHVRSDLALLGRYLGAGTFTADEIEKLVGRQKDIATTGKDRESTAAFKALLSQGKLALDISKAQEPKPPRQHQHAHLHAPLPADGIGDDFIEIAHDVGCLEELAELEGNDRVIEAARRLGYQIKVVAK